MFSWQGGRNALSIFNRKKLGDSSLTSRLIDDVSPEIELSAYGRLPSPGSESPSELLNGDNLKVEPIADLDLFFERLYNYYVDKGLRCSIVKWIVELLSLGFTICFSGFFLLYVDWDGLRNAKCGMNAVEYGVKPCDLAKEALHQHPLTPLTLPKAVILGYLGIFSIYWIFCFFRFFAQLKETLTMRHFYYNSLHVTDCELKTMPWASILEKVVNVQSTQQLCVVKVLSAHDILMRLMRKENYLIGMINKGVLAFPVSKWVPGAGPTVKSGPNRCCQRLILTKTLEWTLNWSILQSMFDRNFCLRRDFLSNPDTLKRRLVVVGLSMFLLSPFLVIFMLVYLFLRHAEHFYNHPIRLSSRRWSNLSKWMFREFNEVEHFYRHRVHSCVIHPTDYLKQFPCPNFTMVAKLVSFISGGLTAVLLIIAFLEESLLEGHVYGRTLFWYGAFFGAVTTVSRNLVPDELLVLDPEGTMSLVVQHTHYMPKRWRGKENTEVVKLEFETLFQYTTMMWLEEMASIFLTPYLLIFVVPKRVDDILQFIAEFTVNIEGVGDVCSLSAFDFQRHGNVNYASPCNSPRSKRSSQGKMEKSLLSFVSSYPYWQPDAQGKQFLTTLETFRERNLGGREQNPSLIPQSTRNSYPRPGCHLGYTDPKPHRYLLDWYYVSAPRQVSDETVDTPMVSVDIDTEQNKDFWDPSFQNEVSKHRSWPNMFEGQSRNHLKASTLEESIIRNQESSSVVLPTGSHWWARGGGPGGRAQEASFLEPPDFAAPQQASFLKAPTFLYQDDNSFFDGISERSIDEEEQEQEREQDVGWRNYHDLSRTSNSGELGEFKLYFDDIFRPPEAMTSNLDDDAEDSAW